MTHQHPIAPPTILVALVLALVLSTSTTTSMPYNTDCMKNPFANGCRGISAKRSSSAQTWSATESANQMEAQPTRASLYDLIAGHQTNQLRTRQLSVVVELLVDATNRLAGLIDWNEFPSGKSNQTPLGDYLGSTAKRAGLGKAGGQREEASK